MVSQPTFQFSLKIANDDPIVRDHRLFQERIMPGVTFVDIVLRFLVSKGIDVARVELRNLLFQHAMVTSPEFDRRLRVTIEDVGEVWTVRALSQRVRGDQPLDNDWVETMQCEVVHGPAFEPQPVDLAGLMAGEVAVHDLDRTYHVMRQTGIEHFDFMKLRGRIHQGPGYLLAEVALGDTACRHLDNFHIHPALLDGATCLMGMLMDDPGHRTYMPVTLGSFHSVGRLPERCFVLLKGQSDAFRSGGDMVYIDLDVYSPTGDHLARLRRFGVLRVRSPQLIRRLGSAAASAAAPAGADWAAQVTALVADAAGRPLSEADAEIGFYDLGLDSQTLIALAKRLEQGLGRPLYPTLLFEHNTTAKLVRHLAETAGEPSAAAVLPREDKDDVGRAVVATVEAACGRSLSDGDRTIGFYDLGLDSQALLGLVKRLEERLSAPLYPTLLFEHNTIDKLVRHLRSASGGPAAPAASVSAEMPEFSFVPVWQSEAWPRLGGSVAGRVMIIHTPAGQPLAEALARHHGAGTVTVDTGVTLDRLLEQRVPPDHVYGLVLSDGPDDPLADPAQGQADGVLTLFRLVKALHAAGCGGRPLGLTWVTSDTQRAGEGDRVTPFGAAVHGFMRTVANEYPRWRCRTVDLDVRGRGAAGLEMPWSQWAAQLAAETGREVAWRRDTRLIHTLRPVSLPTEAPSVFRPGGVYLMVGAGGIALALAQYLAERYRARLVLVGRHAPTVDRQERMARIEAAGGQVLYLQADATRETDMARVVASARARFGRIDGVVHAAIVLRDRMIAEMDEVNLAEVMAPKVQGCIALCRALAGLPLDFLMFLSSAQSFVGSLGQGNYAAASAFEDALAHSLDGHSGYPVQTINWGYWGDVGVVATEAYRAGLQRQGIYPISVPEGLRVLDRVLAARLPQVLALKASPETLASIGVVPGADRDAPAACEGDAATLAAAAAAVVLEDRRRHDGDLAGLPEAFQALERHGRRLLRAVLRDMGAWRDGEVENAVQMRSRLAIAPDHARLFAALLALLRAAPSEDETDRATLRMDGLRLRQRHHAVAAHLDVLEHCLEAYPAVLTGRSSAVAVLFPKGSTALVEPIYRGNPLADTYNQAVARAAERLVGHRLARDPAATVTILEIGAGTGGTTRWVLQALKASSARLRYLYTDVAMMLTPQEDAAFRRDFPFVDFVRLDIEADPLAQGLTAHCADVIIATNVLHATRRISETLRHVRALLAEDGVMICSEITRPAVFTTLVFGLTGGWWRPEDGDCRQPDSPLLSVPAWRSQLAAAGLPPVEVLGLGDDLDSWGQQVIVARAAPPTRAAAPAVTGGAEPIAIIGLAGRYPKAADLDVFWRKLSEGRDCVEDIPADRWPAQTADAAGCNWGGFLDDIDKFDPLLFNISPADAAMMDPQERLFLETVWHLLEDAGYTRADLTAEQVGVFVGAMWSHYQFLALNGDWQGQLPPTSIHASIANRVSHFFDFNGPSLALDTMCSSSLTSLHQACDSIRLGDCTVAVAGGVNITVHPHKYWFLTQAGMASTTGRCRSFGQDGDGFVPGEGVGAVLLKPLSRAMADGDRIHGIIRGSAIDHSGRTGGYLVPDPAAQARTIGAALRKAGIAAADIGYVEAQGTGSALGDAIEIAGLTAAFAAAPPQSCPIGSVKSNIGHLESAAGMASVAKVLLQMRHRQLVPSLHAERINSGIALKETPFVLQRSAAEWPAGRGGLRRAAVSAFGAGGANAHVILEEAAPTSEPIITGEQLIPLSARDRDRLRALAGRLAAALEQGDRPLASVAYTLQVGREALDERLSLIVAGTAELRIALQAVARGETALACRAYWGRCDPAAARQALQAAGGEAAMRAALLGRQLDLPARLWALGLQPAWRLMYQQGKPRRLSLPGYPFARERCWIEVRREAAVSPPVAPPAEPVPTPSDSTTIRAVVVRAIEDIFKLRSEQLSDDRSLSDYGMTSLSGLALIKRLNQELGLSLRTTVLYEHASIQALTGHLLTQQPRPAPSAPQTPAEPSHGFRAVCLMRPGEVEDVSAQPITPREPGDDDVQVLVKAFSLNFADWLCLKGLYPTMPDYPFTPGIEFSGVVLKVGRQVRHVAVGDAVMGLMGFTFGAHSQVLTTPGAFVVRKPEAVSYEDACAFPIAFLTAHQVFERAQPRPGEKVLIHTAAGGVGLVAVQMALAAGVEVFVTAGSAAKLSYLAGLGVQHGINYREEDFAQRVMALTDGKGVDVVVNTLSGEAIQKGLDILAPSGRYVEIAMTALKASERLDLSRLVDNQSFVSVDLRRLFLNEPQRVARDLALAADTLAQGRIRPIIGRIFPFDRIVDAYRCLEDRANIGKLVVTADAPEAAVAVSVPRPTVEERDDAIAVIGMAGRFPGAATLDDFWRLLAEGGSAITPVPADRWDSAAWYDPDPGVLDKTYCPWGGFLADVDKFDPVFFNMSGKEARLTDPAQRLFLEECWTALEMAGYDAAELAASRCGVFVGALAGDYRERMIAAGIGEEAQSFWGNASSVLAARISYYLNLKGPAIAIDTACSSSLVALHLACQSLRAGECEMALAGGVHVGTTPRLHVVSSNAEMLSRDGRCKTFDAAADGFVPGEGVGVLVLKPLAAALRDGDHLLGILRGSGVNQDGRTNGITAPNPQAQTDLEIEVYQRHGIDPATIGYVEAHGTGTKLGDPIEIEALTKAFRKFTDRQGDCPIGSVKTNIGHAITAAGIAGVIKVLLALKYHSIPPSLHFHQPNEHIDFFGSPFYVPTRLLDWPTAAGPRRAAVSSFGFSGTNAHLVIEEAPIPAPRPAAAHHTWRLVPVSAKTDEALRRRLADLRDWLGSAAVNGQNLADLAFTLAVGRTHFARRRAFAVASLEDLRQAVMMAIQGETRASSAAPQGLLALADRYERGENLDWRAVSGAGGQRIILPTYPFARESYWIDGPRPTPAVTPAMLEPSGDPLAGYLYVPRWVPRPVPAALAPNGGTALVVSAGGDPARSAALLAGYDRVVETTPDELEGAVAGSVSAVYYLAAASESESGVTEPAVVGLFRLIKALLRAGYGERALTLTVVTSGAYAVLPDEIPDPQGASLHGFAQSVAKEQPNWTVSSLDLGRDERTTAVAPVASRGTAVAWRCGQRYERVPHAVDLPSPSSGPFKPGGVYVIAGGMGGVGLVFARHLADTVKAQVALLGRSALDATRQAQLDELRRAGGTVIYCQADITDAAATRRALAEVRQRFGHIDGVIQSAMHFAALPVAAMDEAVLRATLAPKLAGTRALAEAVSEDHPDFLMVFSSGQSFTGNAGRAAYAAACQAQDALADGLRRRLPFPVLTVNWGFWATNQGRVNDAVHRASQEVEGAEPLTPAEGIEAVRRIVSAGMPQVLAFHVREHVLRLMGVETGLRLKPAAPVPLVPLAALTERPRPAADEAGLAAALVGLERYCRLALLRVLQSMGALRAADECWEEAELLHRLGIVPGYHRLAGALLAILVEAGLVTRDGQRVRATQRVTAPDTVAALAALDTEAAALAVDHPAVAPHLRLVHSCLGRFPEILRGSVKATDVLFPGSSMDLVAAVYAGNAFADYGNGLAIQAVTTYLTARLTSLRSGERIRLLEIGAGTGGTTRPLLAEIAGFGSHLEYIYTDVSRAFTQHGEREYGTRYPFMRFRPLDIEQPIAVQDIAPGSIDLVLAANVLHATRDIRATLRNVKGLLAANGWLVLNELTHPHSFSTLTFGLLDGWWLFRDAELRQPGTPLIAAPQWCRLLAEQGLAPVVVRGAEERSGAVVGQHVFVAQSDGQVPFPVLRSVEQNAVVPPPAAQPAAVDRVAVVGELTGLAAAVLQLPAETLDVQAPLMDLGLDSLLAVTLVKRIGEHFSVPLTPTDLFDHATIARLAEHIRGRLPDRPTPASALPPAPAVEAVAEARPAPIVSTSMRDDDIAIIGMAGRFPKARDVAEFWDNLAAGRDAVEVIRRWPLDTFYDPDRNRLDRSYCKHGGLLDGIDEFDPLFFSLSPRQAEMMDPRQRLFLQEAWAALETAGYAPAALAGRRCGVFVGCEGSTDYFGRPEDIDPDCAAEYFLGNSNSVLAARIAYLLDFKGPTLTIDTACSSSLVAIHLACESLRRGECDMALAGGAAIMSRSQIYVLLSRMGMLSPSGACHAFDRDADGFVPGEAVGVVVLKPLARALADGDPIQAVIKASGINQDGRTNGITAPSAASQARLENEVHAQFGIDPATIRYVETHGTGTRLGDPIEFEGLRNAFDVAVQHPGCGLGSVKTNIGHAAAAAGVAGLIKAVLALHHRQLPPSLHFKAANEQIDLAGSPFHVVTRLTPWEPVAGQPLRAAVNAFGHSGSNAHVVIEAAPPVHHDGGGARPGPVVVPLSAKTREALLQRAADLVAWLAGDGAEAALADIAYTLQIGRGHFACRLAVVADNRQALAERLRAWLRIGQVDDCYHGSHSAEDLREPNATAARYAAGADVDWAGLWPAPRRRIVLPTYPFARERCWLAEPSRPPATAQTDPHPLLDQDLSSPQQACFATALPGHPLLALRSMGGFSVLPPSVIPELTRAAAETAAGRQVTGLRRLAWNRPVTLGGATGLEIILYPDGDATEFELDVVVDGAAVIHCQGTAVHDAVAPVAVEPLQAVRARCQERPPPAPAVRACWLGRDEGLVDIELPDGGGDAALHLHPAALDGALQCISLLAGSTPMMPYTLAALDIYQPLPRRCTAHVRRVVSAEPDGARFDLWLRDDRGEVLVAMTGYTVKAVKAGERPGDQLDDEALLALFAGLRRGDIALGEAERRVRAGGWQ